MANISTIKVGSTSYGLTPASHASTATTYGAATASNYGHVKLSDNYTSSAGAAASGIGASSLAVCDAYNTLNSKFVILSYTTSSERPTGPYYISTNYTVDSYPASSYCIVGGLIQLNTGNVKQWCSLRVSYNDDSAYSCGYYNDTTITVFTKYPNGTNVPVKIILYKYA